MKKTFLLLFVLALGGSTFGQNKELLFVEDFEGDSIGFEMNKNGSNGENKWIVNDEFSGAGTYTDTPSQDSTLGAVGQIGTPNGKHMHIQNTSSSVVNANYNPKNSSKSWATTKDGYCTFGYNKVVLTFWWLAKGSPADYGEVYYSVDGGGSWKICTNTDGLTKYGNMDQWKYTVIEQPEFLDVGDLRFAFKWTNDGVNTGDELPFAIDDVMLVAHYELLAPVEISALAWVPNPVCHEAIQNLIIQFRVEEELCDGIYQVELSDSGGNFATSTVISAITLPFTPGTFNTNWQIPLSTALPIGSCYKFRVNRITPPYITGNIYDGCIEIIDCLDSIITKQPAVTKDASGYVCNFSVIDVPFNSFGAYEQNNEYILQLSDSSGNFDNPYQIGGPMPDATTYDPALPTNPPPSRDGSIGGMIDPAVPPGCNYYVRVISTFPQVDGTPWGPFCIEECDILTNNKQDITVCITDEDSACVYVQLDINQFDSSIFYNNGNKFTFSLHDAMTMAQVFSDQYGLTYDTQSGQFLMCVPKLPEYAADGLEAGKMYYMRIFSDNSSDPTNQLGSLIHFTANGVSGLPLTITVNPDEVLCGATDVVWFTALPVSPSASGSQYKWNLAGYPYTSGNQVGFYASFFPTGTSQITVQEISSSPDCVGPVSAPAYITVNGPPDVDIVGDLDVCVGDTVSYTSNFIAATYYSWQFNDPSGKNVIVDSSNTGVTIAWNEFGSSALTLTALGRCGENEGSENVTVVPPSTIKTYPGRDTLICSKDGVTIIAVNTSYPVNNTFAWLLKGDTLRSEYKQFGNSDTLPMVFPTKETDYLVSVDNGCPTIDTVTIRVMEIPKINELDGKVCQGDSVQLDATAEGAISYSWTPTVGLSDPTIANPLCTPGNSTEYIVVVTYDSLCPPESDTVNVVMNSPAVDAGDDEEIFKGDQVQLNATGAATYSWYPLYGLSDTTIANPIANPDTTTTYILFGKDGYDCLVMDTMIVVVKPFLFEPVVPDAFTPDGNLLNDNFLVYDILGIDGEALETFDLKVFNRWGEIVYEGTDIMEGWNGRHYKTGKEMEVGVYVWLVTAITTKGEKYGPMSGNVSLIR